jgi:hypothetical protein
MTEHKIGLMIGEYRAFIERIAWCSMGVINLFADIDRQNKTAADGLGTGTACTWKGHRLILTAEHVLAKAEPANLAFLLRVDDAISWEETGRPEEVVPRVSLPVERIVRCKEHDLAAIVLRAHDLSGFRMRFCELPKQLATSRKLRREGSLILLGYPTDRIFPLAKTKTAKAETNYHAVRPTILAGTIADPPSKALSRQYDRERDVLIDYRPNDPKMKPYGFSGAAVWKERAKRPGRVWTADPMIFGLQTSWHMTSKLLQVVGAPTIRQFLEEKF